MLLIDYLYSCYEHEDEPVPRLNRCKISPNCMGIDAKEGADDDPLEEVMACVVVRVE